METTSPGFEFEQPMLDIEIQLRMLEKNDRHTEVDTEEIRRLRRRWTETTRGIYANLTPWQIVQVSRHKDRPYTRDYLNLAFDEFIELHGDRFFGDDRAVLTGFAKLGRHKVLVVGHQKGRTYKERAACHFGCAHPEGYRKSMSKMKLAEKYRLPIICFIDTPGAYPGIGAEERGQAQVIAESMFLMSQLKTPIICVVIGEGGSGGALGIGVGNKIAMLQYAYYSVISPEGCAGILWKSHQFASKAADALRFTSSHLAQLGVIDDVIEEPLGGAHRDPRQMAARLKAYLTKTLDPLVKVSPDDLATDRYNKFRKMGTYLEQMEDGELAIRGAVLTG